MVWRARHRASGTQLQILCQGHWATIALVPLRPRSRQAAHSVHRCRHLLLTQPRAAVPATPADGDQAPRLVVPHHPTLQTKKYRRQALPRLRTGPRGHCSKEGSGTPPGPSRYSTQAPGQPPWSNPSPRGHRHFSYWSLSFLLCEREIIRVLPPRVVVKGVTHLTNTY